MITAKKALAKSKENRLELDGPKSKLELQQIEKAIEEAISIGSTWTKISFYPCLLTRERLEEMGYKFVCRTTPGATLYAISWEEK